MTPRLAPEEDMRRREMYAQGWSDYQIAAAVGTDKVVIRNWRKRRGLAPNFAPGRNTRASSATVEITDDLRDTCRRLVRKGVGPTLIAATFKIAHRTAEHYREEALREDPTLARPVVVSRRAPRFPNGRYYSAMRPDRRRQVFALYAAGLSDAAIAAELGTSSQAVHECRTRFSLPSNFAPGQRATPRPPRPVRRPAGPAITPRTNAIYAAVADAVGRTLSPDMADDAISDLVLAVLEGRVALDQVAREARRYRGRVLTEYASRRTRSIDEQLGDGDGFRLVDMLRDDRSSDWLEESGASAW